YLFFYTCTHRAARSTLFPYTTLFRSLGVALVGVLVELVRRQGNALSEVAENVQVARDHVANTHATNLRDDIDSLMYRLDRVMDRSEEHTSELQSREKIVCRLLLENKN